MTAVVGESSAASISRRLLALAARIVAIVILVVMLSGWSVAPNGMPDAATDRFVPSLSVRSPRIVLAGDAVGIDVSAALPTHDVAGRTATADLVDATGATIASASLVGKAATPIDGRPEGGRLRGRIVWRPASAGGFSASVRIRGEDDPVAAPVSLQVTDGPLRVFLLDRPRFESRFLSRMLSRDARFEVTARILGPTSPGDGEDPPREDVAELPATRDAWNRFDAVVIGSIDPLAVPEPVAAALVEAAANDGVGIVWSLDAASDPEAIAVSPLGRLLPFRGVSRHPPFTTRCGIRLAAPGEEAAWLAVADDAVISREAWRTMPPVYAAVEPSVIRPTARVMAECVPVATVAGASRPTTPFILVDQAGEAMVVTMLAETWRLRQGARGALVDRLLSQTVLHAAEPHLASRLIVDTTAGPQPNSDDGLITDARSPRESTANRALPPAARPVWNHPAILLALLAACGVEWWVRERLGDGP